MTDSQTRNVVVVDDNWRFALHVWQFLAAGLAFGIGDVSKEDGQRLFSAGDAPRGLPTRAFTDAVWWVDAARPQEEIERALRQVIAACSTGPCTILLDVRGPRGRADAAPYDVTALLTLLVEEAQCRLDLYEERGVGLLSAYSKAFFSYGGQSLRIREKSTHTLKLLLRQPPESAAPEGVLHVLVTGAGFELRNVLFGQAGKAFGTPLGIPPTPALIQEALDAVESVEARPSDRELGLEWEKGGDGLKRGFPYPRHWKRTDKDPFLKVPVPLQGLSGKTTTKDEILSPAVLKYAAGVGLLDMYWNELLDLELRFAMAKGSPAVAGSSTTATERKLYASRWEFELREAFRRVFLKYDWGYLNQALDASQLPWSAWLTTNYTGFSNRAIELSGRPWRIVSTSNEAARLLREILHGPRDAGLPSKRPFLFKLHGDIAHLTTMAIAGHDKEIFTPLSLPIDSLHQIYVAAEQYLRRMIQSHPDKPTVVWHLVGHGLADQLLLQTLIRIYRDAPDRHTFVVVNPQPEDPVAWLTGENVSKSSIGIIPMTAEEYLSCVRRRVPLASWTDFVQWEKAMPVKEALRHQERCNELRVLLGQVRQNEGRTAPAPA